MYKVPYFLQPNDWMMKIDLSQAYFHVPVAESHRRFLRFVAPCGHPSWCPEDPPQHCVWQMTSLPFGLASAPRTFATLSNWVAQQLRLRGMRVLVYLDDFLLVNQSRRRLRDHAHQAKALLHELGWVINKGKSSAQPVQNIEFLGIKWSTVQNIKSLPREKLFKLQGCLEKFLVAPAWSPLDLQKLVGWLNFASFIVPYGRINFRSLLTLMQRAVREGISVVPTAQAVVDLQWWINHFKEVSEIWLQPPTHFIVTDASDVGWGAYVDGHYLQGPWLAQETSFRGNRKELLAISFVLQNMAQVFADKTILVQSDNQTALAYLRNQGGTRSEPLLSRYSKEHLHPLNDPSHSSDDELHSRPAQLCIGQSVEVQSTPRVASSSNSDQIDISQVGNTNNRSICFTERSRSSPICNARPERSSSRLPRCLQQNLDLQAGVDIPATVPDASGVVRDEPSARQVHSDLSSVAECVLEGGPKSKGTMSILHDSQPAQSVEGHYHRSTSSTGRPPSIRGMADSGWDELLHDWSPSQRSLVESSWRPSTLRTYKQSTWRCHQVQDLSG
ncbi:unnamed protein product [Plutella xylostella]|uniref:(diamondback moth) hypothetical protein n=1 Tax=Plutella xylostella TaxID=51655 RepID=A0A8S4G9B0_PLUXY|nr:unnamed protein product [Plutella xylostella]